MTTRSDQKSPYFKFFPRDFFSSSRVSRMTSEEQGIYCILLMREWLDGFIPSDVAEIAEMLDIDLETMKRYWKRIGRCFVPADGEPHKLVNARLEVERAQMIAKSKKSSEAINTRWERERADKPVLSSEAAQSNPVNTVNQVTSVSDRTTKNTGEYHADADADAEYTDSVDKSTPSAIAAKAPSLSTGSKKSHRKSQDLSLIEPERDRETSYEPPQAPTTLPNEWPQEIRKLKLLAIEFLAAFGNSRSKNAQKAHGAAYTDALSAIRNRKHTPREAWIAFGNCRLAHDGKPLFGAQAKSAMNYLPDRQWKNGGSVQPPPAPVASGFNAALALMRSGGDV